MLKNSSLKRMIISSLVLFFAFCLYKFPRKVNYQIDNRNIEHRQVYLVDRNNYVSLVDVDCPNNSDKITEIYEILINHECLPYGFVSYLNKDTKLLDYSMKDGLLKLNFSKEFNDIKVGYEEQMLEMVIYSFTSLDNVDSIMIFVDGVVLDKLPNSGKKIPILLDRSYGINKVIDVTTLNDSVSFNVYYLGKNESYYYIPVTYIINKDDDVAQMIVKKLKSNSISSSLLTHIDDNIEMVDYKVNGNDMELIFDNDLKNVMFDGIMDEEVEYVLTASFKDSFSVEKVEISFTS